MSRDFERDRHTIEVLHKEPADDLSQRTEDATTLAVMQQAINNLTSRFYVVQAALQGLLLGGGGNLGRGIMNPTPLPHKIKISWTKNLPQCSRCQGGWELHLWCQIVLWGCWGVIGSKESSSCCYVFARGCQGYGGKWNMMPSGLVKKPFKHGTNWRRLSDCSSSLRISSIMHAEDSESCTRLCK